MSSDIVQKEVNRAVSPEHSLCIDVSVPKIKQTVLTFKVSKHSFTLMLCVKPFTVRIIRTGF